MIAITYIGHATTLVESNGLAVLTDPNFSKKVLCLKRMEPLNYDAGKLPKLSAIVISHAHYDHLDLFSFKYISSSVPIFVPEGLGKFLSKYIRNPVIELAPWGTHKLPSGVEITATEARHIGFRWTGLRYRQCRGYVISIPQGEGTAPSRVFFAGDTGYGPHFKEIGNLYNGVNLLDAALLPIGGYQPVWMMKNRHLNPDQAIEAFLDTGAKNMIPIHFGTFRLSLERPSEPLERLSRLAIERNVGDRIHILKSGEKTELLN